MYSMVLMMAMASGADTPAFGHNKGCSGCSGCYGCSGCSGCSGCHGCSGGHKLFGGHGCSGSCHGCSGSSCHGCSGGSCHGCSGGCHGFLGGHKHGCHGCSGCSGCCGGGACYGGACYGCAGGGVIMSAPVYAPAAPMVAPTPPPPPPAKKVSDSSTAPATIVVVLPADAKLTVDGNATRSTSAERTFVSPTLEQGKEYFYTLQAETLKDGNAQVVTKRVSVRAGELTRVVLEFPEASIVQK